MVSQHYQSHSCVPVVCTGTKNQNSRATLACPWFAQGISPNQNSFQGIIRKECQSFTNHVHAKTPPTVFNPLSLWLTLPRDMGVSHTLWPPSITRAILACLWFAQYDVQGDSMYSILSVDATYFFSTLSPLEKVPFATFYHLQKYLRGTYFSKKTTFSSGLNIT